MKACLGPKPREVSPFNSGSIDEESKVLREDKETPIDGQQDRLGAGICVVLVFSQSSNGNVGMGGSLENFDGRVQLTLQRLCSMVVSVSKRFWNR